MFKEYECSFLKFLVDYMSIEDEYDISTEYMYDESNSQVHFHIFNPRDGRKYLERGVRVSDLKEMLSNVEKINEALDKLKREVPEILI